MRSLMTDLELRTYGNMSLAAAVACVEEGHTRAKEALHTQYMKELRRCDDEKLESCDKDLVTEMYKEIMVAVERDELKSK